MNFKDNIYPGKLITFCGLDGSGKTTMIELLEKYLVAIGNRCVIVKQPTKDIRNNPLFRASIDQPYSEGIDYRAVSMLCAADKLQHTTKVIEPLLKDGYTVISDRYYYSSLANLIAYGFYEEKWIYEVSVNIIKPVFAFFLSVDPDLAEKRVHSREKEKGRFIDLNTQKRLAKAYSEIALCNDGIIIDCNNNISDAFEQIKNIIDGGHFG